MSKRKNFLDDGLTADWLRDNGIALKSFATTHIKLLQAQQAAHNLLSQNKNLLSIEQIKTLTEFQDRMANPKQRTKIKSSIAYPILNINTKINRQIFKQNRHQSNH